MSNSPGDDGVPPDSASNPSIAPFFGTPGQLHTHKQWTDLLLPFFFAFFSPFSFTDFSSSWSFGRTERTHRKTHHSGDFLRFNYERTNVVTLVPPVTKKLPTKLRTRSVVPRQVRVNMAFPDEDTTLAAAAAGGETQHTHTHAQSRTCQI